MNFIVVYLTIQTILFLLLPVFDVSLVWWIRFFPSIVAGLYYVVPFVSKKLTRMR